MDGGVIDSGTTMSLTVVTVAVSEKLVNDAD